MRSEPSAALRRDHRFEHWKVPASDEMRALVTEVLAEMGQIEQRIRARTAATQRNHERCVSAMVCDLVHQHLKGPGRRIMVPLAKSALGPHRRPAPFITEAFAATVQCLADPRVDIARLDTGAKTPFGNVQSTLEGGPWLVSQVEAKAISFADIGRDLDCMDDPLILRSSKVGGHRDLLDVPDTPEARLVRQELHSINRWLAAADVSWIGQDETVDSRDRYLRRIFANASLRQGGRLYHGFWIQLRKRDRLEGILINGEPVVELDFGQMGVRLAYGIVGATPPDGDLYQVFGLGASREGVKTILNALLSTGVTPKRFPKGTKKHFPRRLRFADVYDAICLKHPALVPLFGSASWATTQYLESSIAVRALLDLQQRGIVGLPIHDGLIVAHSNAEVAKESLEAACRAVAGVEAYVELVRGAGQVRNKAKHVGINQ